MNQQVSASDELSRNRRIGVLLISCMSLFIVGLDITVVNVALPAIGQDLHAGISGLQWTVGAYTVVMASLLMFSGSMADRLGRRRTFVTGLAVFSVASLLCSLAPSVGLLVVFRVLQAVGASMMNPVAMSIITNTFTNPRERAQAVGIWGAVFGISMALGPIVGGALVSAVGWRSIFLINIPVGLAAILLTLRFIPESRAPRPRRFDPVGQALVIVLLATLTYGIIEAPSRGWSSAVILAALSAAGGGAPGAAPLRAPSRGPARRPALLPVDPVHVVDRHLGGGVRRVRRVPLPEHAVPPGGTRPLAGTGRARHRAHGLMTVVASTLSGRMVGRRGPRLPLVISGVCSVTACAMLTGIEPATPFAWLFAAYVIFGLGFGFVNAPITNAAVSGMPRAQAGVASAIATTSRQFGQTLGVAVVGAIVTSRVGASLRCRPVVGEPRRLVDAHGLRSCRAPARFHGHHRPGQRVGRRTAAQLNPEALAV